MAKGRNRKTCPRQPNGQPQRVRDVPPAEVRAIIAFASAKARRDGVMLGSEIGRLRVLGRLTDEHVATATAFATTYQTWCAILGVPNPNPRAVEFGAVRGMGGEIPGKTVDFVKSRMMGEMTGASNVLSRREYDVLVDVSVRDHAACGGSFPALVSALTKIGEAWGLTWSPSRARNIQ